MRARIAAIAAAAAALVLVAPAAAGLQRDARLGNNTEGATAITSGPNAGQVAVIDGYDVIAIPVDGKGRTPHTLFAVKSVPFAAFASGIAYIPTERTYLLGDQGDFETVQAVRDDGTLLSPRTVTYLPGFDPDAVIATEGMTYLPVGSPWPDSFARALTLFDGETFIPDIEILGRDGTVKEDVEVSGLPDESYVTGLAYRGADGFLVTTGDNHAWRIGFDGTVLGPATTVPDATALEGLTSFADGRVYGADYAAGKLLALDRNLVRKPAGDRHYEIGVGVTRAFDAFWDNATSSWMVLGLDRDFSTIVATVSPTLDSRHVLFHPSGFFVGLTGSPGLNVSMCNFDRAGIETYSRSGVLVDFLDFTTIPGVPQRRCSVLTYLGSIDAFGVKFPGFANRQKVFLISRSGTLLGVITAPMVVAAVSVAPEDPNLLLVWGVGDLLAEYDATTQTLLSLGTRDRGQMVSPFGFAGGLGGSYALLDGNDSEFAVFSP